MKAIFLLRILAPALIPATAGAATISGSLNALTGPVNLSSGTDDWAYYGADNTPTGLIVKASGANAFSALTGGFISAADSRVGINFTGGTPTADLTNATDFVFGPQSDGGSVSYSVTIGGGEQLLQVYLVSYNSRANITATLGSGASYSLMGAVLPSTTDGDLTGAGHANGLLSLYISDADAGDVVTFNIQNSYAGASQSSFGFTGIQAASLTVIPETSTLSLLVLSAFFISKRKR